MYNTEKYKNGKKLVRTEIKSGTISIQNRNDNNIGTFFQFGFGRFFNINRIICFTELSYRQGINRWIYKPIQLINTPFFIGEYPIYRQSIVLKIGIFFNSKPDESKQQL